MIIRTPIMLKMMMISEYTKRKASVHSFALVCS